MYFTTVCMCSRRSLTARLISIGHNREGVCMIMYLMYCIYIHTYICAFKRTIRWGKKNKEQEKKRKKKGNRELLRLLSSFFLAQNNSSDFGEWIRLFFFFFLGGEACSCPSCPPKVVLPVKSHSPPKKKITHRFSVSSE